MENQKNKSEVRGIKITKEIKVFFEKAIEKAGSMRKLADACDIYAASISRWTGNSQTKSIDCIDWPNWEKVWLYLTKEEIISPDDIRWMPPSVLREGIDLRQDQASPRLHRRFRHSEDHQLPGDLSLRGG